MLWYQRRKRGQGQGIADRSRLAGTTPHIETITNGEETSKVEEWVESSGSISIYYSVDR